MGYQLSLTTGENLVLISHITFEISKIEQISYKLFLYAKGKELERQNVQFWISQKWFEISQQIFTIC